MPPLEYKSRFHTGNIEKRISSGHFCLPVASEWSSSAEQSLNPPEGSVHECRLEVVELLYARAYYSFSQQEQIRYWINTHSSDDKTIICERQNTFSFVENTLSVWSTSSLKLNCRLQPTVTKTLFGKEEQTGTADIKYISHAMWHLVCRLYCFSSESQRANNGPKVINRRSGLFSTGKGQGQIKFRPERNAKECIPLPT